MRKHNVCIELYMCFYGFEINKMSVKLVTKKVIDRILLYSNLMNTLPRHLTLVDCPNLNQVGGTLEDCMELFKRVWRSKLKAPSHMYKESKHTIFCLRCVTRNRKLISSLVTTL